MTKAIKITIVATTTYIPNPEYYEEGLTLEEMAEVDSMICKSDPQSLCGSDFDSWEVTYELVDLPDDSEPTH